jgi:hypothetical protein
MKYVTRHDDQGFDFRTIADIMTSLGYPMGHSTARSYVNKVMEKMACVFMIANGITGDPSIIAQKIGFQKCIEELICEVYAEIYNGMRA